MPGSFCYVWFIESSVVHKEAVINDTDGKFAFGTAMGPSGRPVWSLGPLVDTSNKIVLTKTRKSENKRGNTCEYVISRDSMFSATANGNKVGKN
jgi:hypothetical protein